MFPDSQEAKHGQTNSWQAAGQAALAFPSDHQLLVDQKALLIEHSRMK
jgi:hypothetical protein